MQIVPYLDSPWCARWAVDWRFDCDDGRRPPDWSAPCPCLCSPSLLQRNYGVDDDVVVVVDDKWMLNRGRSAWVL